MSEQNNPFPTREYENWITFYLNYLSPYLAEDNFPLFQKKWQSYWKLFQLWKEKRLENEEIKSIVKGLVETKKPLPWLVKKYEKKGTINENLIEKELKNLWNDELTQMVSTNQQKVHNYLLGQIRKKFPDYPPKEVILVIASFLKEKRG
ncbi:hypothetical protein [endosymbiont DhMRE of Dentiscutata heterogama]|uniref:hypothetical protein n=1 Tax=endosymbiont DhMRE of Dentiscutata heterogama TaxID=1609546 RepID=UPI002AD4B3A9|nr:hypothetical protein [endosymbiont DhMRE of Dentiscutata heterogama]